MKLIKQTLSSILKNLGELEVDWKDDAAKFVIKYLENMSIKTQYSDQDIKDILSDKFEEGILICRLFLGLSKDSFTSALNKQLGPGGAGINRFKKEEDKFIEALKTLGLIKAMIDQTNRQAKWSDVLVERLRSGRGSAISGQKRGRGVEDFVENIIQKVFGTSYDARCSFTGKTGNHTAKCDFAIPSKDDPRIVIEAKGYGATGSKMSDVVGDVDSMINAKRSDTALLVVTDGMSWHQRQSDLKKLVKRQNQGDILRIYTKSMKVQIESDLNTLKIENQI